MYASIKPTYNFYIPEYETATSDPNNTMSEAILPSMYVMLTEMTKEPEEEKNDFARALRRRELRLILAGKKQPGDSHELKKLFADK